MLRLRRGIGFTQHVDAHWLFKASAFGADMRVEARANCSVLLAAQTVLCMRYTYDAILEIRKRAELQRRIGKALFNKGKQASRDCRPHRVESGVTHTFLIVENADNIVICARKNRLRNVCEPSWYQHAMDLDERAIEVLCRNGTWCSDLNINTTSKLVVAAGMASAPPSAKDTFGRLMLATLRACWMLSTSKAMIVASG